MARNDLVIVIPGITGSTLTRDGKDIWSSKPTTLLAALATLGQNVRNLHLPNDIGDQAPDDGIEAAALISHLHFIPGWWTPIHGYDKLVQRLRTRWARTGRDLHEFRDLNPILFPYDWRLSNRYTARLLKVYSESVLSRWRDCAPQNRDAKIIFVCHSMGGLIARWYISKEGGAPLARKMITLGTQIAGRSKPYLSWPTDHCQSSAGSATTFTQPCCRSPQYISCYPATHASITAVKTSNT